MICDWDGVYIGCPIHAPLPTTDMSPKGIQLSRAKGWRKPAGAIVVSRPSKWGNPFRVDIYGREQAVAMFRRDLDHCIRNPWAAPHTIEIRIMAESIEELRGHDLACWCALDQPCHRNVLLELANPRFGVRENNERKP